MWISSRDETLNKTVAANEQSEFRALCTAGHKITDDGAIFKNIYIYVSVC